MFSTKCITYQYYSGEDLVFIDTVLVYTGVWLWAQRGGGAYPIKKLKFWSNILERKQKDSHN